MVYNRYERQTVEKGDSFHFNFLALVCEDPGPGVNATLVKAPSPPYRPGDTLTYECDPGCAVTSGKLTIECLDNTFWSDEPPTCSECLYGDPDIVK